MSVTDINNSEHVEEDEQTLEKEETEHEECGLPEEEVEMDGFKVGGLQKRKRPATFSRKKRGLSFSYFRPFDEPPEEESNEDEDHMIKARNLKETLAQFKVEIELGEVHTGPVITRYDVHP